MTDQTSDQNADQEIEQEIEQDQAQELAKEQPVAVDHSAATGKPIRVLLLDDEPDNLLLRSTILRQHGYSIEPTATIEEARKKLKHIDIAVLDYHLGAGQFGTEVAAELRKLRPEVPILILSATLEQHFGGVEDMHLLKGQSSIEELVAALRSFELKLRGRPVVVDAQEFFYSRISRAMGEDCALQIFDSKGNWQYVNEFCAQLLEHPREWFIGRNLFTEIPDLNRDWRGIIRNVAETRETYLDRTHRGVLDLAGKGSEWIWSLIAFPLKLHNGETGVVLMARRLMRRSVL